MDNDVYRYERINMRDKISIAVAAVLMVAQSALADPAQSPVEMTPTMPATSPTPSGPPNAATPTPPPAEEDSASYVGGYSDGCATANLRYARQAHVKPNKDSKLYDGDKEYHDGWNKGYRKCEDKTTPGGLSVPANSVVM